MLLRNNGGIAYIETPIHIIMKTWFLFTLLCFCSFGFSQLPRVSVRDNQFVVNGEPIIFHGMSSSDPEKLMRDQHWNKQYFEVMKSWGANLVRFPIHPNAWRKLGKEKYIALLDEGIKYAGDLGMYVIIDWHSHHAEQYRDQAVAFFREMAQTYGHHNHVIYEVYNEPLQVSWSGVIKPYATAVINAIRAVDPDNLIIVGTPTWSQDVDQAANDRIVAAMDQMELPNVYRRAQDQLHTSATGRNLKSAPIRSMPITPSSIS